METIPKATLRNKLSEMKLLTIDEFSMVSSNLWIDIDSSLGEVCLIIPKKAFAGLSVTTVADFLQLPQVKGKLIFSQFSDNGSIKNLLTLQL